MLILQFNNTLFMNHIVKVAFCMVLIMLTSCGPGPVRDQGFAEMSVHEGGPYIEFRNIRHDFGTVRHGEKLVHTFRYRNTGDAPLIIHSSSADCGCTVPEFDGRPIGPGEEGGLRVVFDTRGFRGRQVKTINLFTNADNAMVTLALRVMIE
ncbi:MAG: DUF1573 domain-containing protein [Marinilabiliales bacterium]|nr:MAG: DUF1573 domain-containing protein [Marinilabiliales bacterium]